MGFLRRLILKVRAWLCNHDWEYKEQIRWEDLSDYLFRRGVDFIDCRIHPEENLVEIRYYRAVCRKCGKEMIVSCGIHAL